MRKAPICAGAFLIALLSAQEPTIRSTVPLVVIPASVTDAKGAIIDGLTASDFLLLDDGKPRTVFADEADPATRPLSLVIAIQTNDISRAALEKIRKTGSVITDAVLGANGQVAVIGYNEKVALLLDFTNDSPGVSEAFRKMKGVRARRARMVDAVEKGLDLIADRLTPRRAALLIIGESRDRGSEGSLDHLLRRLQSSDTTIYGLSYSAFLTPFTTRASDYIPPEGDCSPPLALAVLCYAPEIARLAKINTIETLVQATGGRHLAFETLAKLESDLLNVSEDLHSRYTLSFTPPSGAPPGFHRLELRVENNPGVVVRARPSYWLGAVDPPGVPR